jgi:hypothetical protein
MSTYTKIVYLQNLSWYENNGILCIVCEINCMEQNAKFLQTKNFYTFNTSTASLVISQLKFAAWVMQAMHW